MSRALQRIKEEASFAVRHPLFWIGAAAAVPALFAFELFRNTYEPRRPNFDCLTILQSIEKPWYELWDRRLDNERSLDSHMDFLDDNIDDFDQFRKDVWDYVTFWYRPKTSAADDGLGMKTYEEVCRGEPGSCTEGAFAFWANMRQRVELPKTGEKLEHYLLLVTYEKSDMKNTASHCLYLGERIRKDGSKAVDIGGINPFEDPLVEYDTIEQAIEANTNHFRMYGYSNLHEERNPQGRRVMVRPQRYCVIHPERDLHVDIMHSAQGTLNVIIEGKDPRDTQAEALQRRFMDFFDRHAQMYKEPYAKVEK